MKIRVFSLAIPFLLVSGAIAQNYGNIVVNAGSSVNCVTVAGETGFEASSWTWGGSDTVNIKSGNRATAPSLTGLTIVKTIDRCSQQLIQNFLSGQDFNSVVLVQYSVPTASGAPLPLTQVTLTNAFLDNYSVTGATSTHPAENLSFVYQKICVKNYTYATNGGTQPTTFQVCYNAQTGIVSSN